MEPTSTKQWGLSFLLKESTGAFDGARTLDWQASIDYESDALPLHQDVPLYIDETHT